MEGHDKISDQVIEDEMKKAYMSYAMSVIVGRALPDVRDGLKPVHRRILYSMDEMGLQHNKSFKKSARIVGDAMGKYHPHGDSAVYDSLVRMAQDFSLRYPLIKGQGNFGSVDNDPPAAQRYTEAKLAKISQELLKDIDKETIVWTENFDGSLKEPTVLPSVVPNLLINGSSGIAVGMATNIPPHNLTEVCNAAKQVVENPEISVNDLMQHITGPDFPTGGIIQGDAGIKHAYATGRGKITVKGVIQREEKGDRVKLIIPEIPYQVVKADLIIQIAELVRDKVIEDISDIRDESDRDGMRIVIELKKDANVEVVENNLYKYTKLRQTFGIINLALVNNEPKVLSLPEMLRHFVNHRVDVITKRTEYDLKKAKDRAHILEGLLIALESIDEVITLIKGSQTAELARSGLTSNYTLSVEQANAILDMKLQRLTGLEQTKIKDEHKTLTELIADLTDILDKPERVKGIIKTELTEISETYGDQRRTQISEDHEEIEVEDLIDSEEMIITISNRGYIKRLKADTYQSQKRGGMGIKGASTKNDDFVEHLFVANTHNYLLFLTNKGRVYWKKVFKIPEASRTAKGTALVNVVEIRKDEKVSAVIPVAEFNDDRYLFFATKKGHVKKTSLKYFSKPRNGGIQAIMLRPGDDVVNVRLTDGSSKILLASAAGQAVRFDENDVRPMGRVSSGVRGILLKQEDYVISLSIAEDQQTVFTITENGFGKRSPVDDYRLIKRGGSGVRNIVTSDRNGRAVVVMVVDENDDLLLMSQQGIAMRTTASEISVIGRNTQGMRVMRLKSGDKVSGAAKIVAEDA